MHASCNFVAFFGGGGGVFFTGRISLGVFLNYIGHITQFRSMASTIRMRTTIPPDKRKINYSFDSALKYECSRSLPIANFDAGDSAMTNFLFLLLKFNAGLS